MLQKNILSQIFDPNSRSTSKMCFSVRPLIRFLIPTLSSIVEKRFPFIGLFSFWNRKRLQGAKSGEYRLRHVNSVVFAV